MVPSGWAQPATTVNTCHEQVPSRSQLDGISASLPPSPSRSIAAAGAPAAAGTVAQSVRAGGGAGTAAAVVVGGGGWLVGGGALLLHASSARPRKVAMDRMTR